MIKKYPYPDSPIDEFLAMHTLNGGEVIGFADKYKLNLRLCIQGGMCTRLTTGHRLPQFLINNRQKLSLGWMIPVRDHFLERHPPRIYSIPSDRLVSMTTSDNVSHPSLIDRENVTNTILLKVETRAGAGNYLSEDAVIEDTPSGWRRHGQGHYIVQDDV